jgi:branched-chain amino acid transport system permease protein
VTFGPHLFLALLEGTVAAFVLALTALGLSLVFGVMRIVNVAHGEFFMLGAVFAWAFSSLIPARPALGFISRLSPARLRSGDCAACRSPGAAPAPLPARSDHRRHHRAALHHSQSVLSLYGPYARPVPAPIEFRVQFPWFGYSGYKLVVIAAAGFLLAATWYVLMRTRIGLVMRATQFDRETAQAFAIPVERVYSMIFALGAMLAAGAGVLIVPIQQAHYLMGLDPLLLSFITVIVGGLGSLRGTIVAAFLIGISDGIVSVFFSPTLAKIIATLFVAMVLVFRPSGLFAQARS